MGFYYVALAGLKLTSSALASRMLGLTGITKFGGIGTLLFVYVFISTTRDWTQHAPTSKPRPQLIPSIFICEGWISLRGKRFKKSCLSAGVCVQDGPKWNGCVSGAETQLSDNAHRLGLTEQPLEHRLPACLQSERCQSSEELESEPSLTLALESCADHGLSTMTAQSCVLSSVFMGPSYLCFVGGRVFRPWYSLAATPM